MRRAIRNKLNSRAGASIIFALLLFLVCAVVGSVVLAAGTAASGRFSDLKEMDARYYSVTSAARLLQDALSGKSVEVKTVKTTVTHTSTPYINGTAGTAAVTVDETVADPVYPGVDTASRVLIEAAGELKAGLISSQIKSFTLTHTSVSGTVETEALQVTVTRELSPDGTLRLTLHNTAGDPYSLILTFSCEQNRRVDRKTEEGSPMVSASSAEEYTVAQDVTRIETETLTYRWTLTDMRKAVG